MRSPVFIVGPGRCATSSTTKFLMETLGYFAGWQFLDRLPGSGDNPYDQNGLTYEDVDFANMLFRHKAQAISYEQFVRGLQFHITERQRLATRHWCAKSPGLSEIVPLLRHLCPTASFLRCWRPVREVVESYCRYHPKPDFERWLATTTMREEKLNDTLDPAWSLTVTVDDWKQSRAEQMIADWCQQEVL